MKNIVLNKPYFEVLKHSNKKLRKALLENATASQRRALIEVLLNTINGNIPLSKKALIRFKLHKRKLRNLCKICYNSKNKKIINVNSPKTRKAITQIGGVLPLIIAPLLALIGKAIAGGVVSAGAGYATKKIIDSATGVK